MRLNREFIKAVIPQAQFDGLDFPEHVSFSIDTRSLEQGEIFICLKGKTRDGHEFIEEAIEKGAVGLFINDSARAQFQKKFSSKIQNLTLVYVPDTYVALITIATAWREQFTYPVIGITGSVGKTTTKEMLTYCMKLANKKCLSSFGNQNTELGCALSVLKMTADYDVAIFEMGISKRGEMARLAAIVKPTNAIITMIGHSHMEGLGSIYDIAAEKRDIFKYFKDDSIGIVNGDQAMLATYAYKHPVIRIGCKMTNQFQARKIQTQGDKTNFVFKLYRERFRMTMLTNHSGPIMCGLSAAAAAHINNVPSAVIVKALETFEPLKSRFQRRTLKGKNGIVIDDCYNASPESMKAALLAFEKVDQKGQKIAVLGDMLELGVNSPFWHRQLGRFLRKVPSLNHVVLVGDNIKWAQKTIPPFVTFDLVANWQAAIATLSPKLVNDTVILVKGSHGMGLDNLVNEVSE